MPANRPVPRSPACPSKPWRSGEDEGGSSAHVAEQAATGAELLSSARRAKVGGGGVRYTECPMPPIVLITSTITREELKKYLLDGTLVKAVVDIERKVMAIGGGLHADEEQVLLEEGSKQENLWGINLYPDDKSESWIEFDSMINIRPNQGNRSRGVEDKTTQEKIRSIVSTLVS